MVFDDGTVSRLAETRSTSRPPPRAPPTSWRTWSSTARRCGRSSRSRSPASPTSGPAWRSPGRRAARSWRARSRTPTVGDAALPFMGVLGATIAGCPVRLLRISFSGELAYEIHTPADYGTRVWQALLERRRGGRHRALRHRGDGHAADREGPCRRRGARWPHHARRPRPRPHGEPHQGLRRARRAGPAGARRSAAAAPGRPGRQGWPLADPQRQPDRGRSRRAAAGARCWATSPRPTSARRSSSRWPSPCSRVASSARARRSTPPIPCAARPPPWSSPIRSSSIRKVAGSMAESAGPPRRESRSALCWRRAASERTRVRRA